MKKKLLALLFISLLGLSACQNAVPEVTTVPPETTTKATAGATTEAPEITTPPPEATTEPLPPFDPIPIPDTVEGQGGNYVTDGNYIYFADPLNGYALTRMNMDLSDPVVLDDGRCGGIHLDSQFVYYNVSGYDTDGVWITNIFRMSFIDLQPELLIERNRLLGITDVYLIVSGNGTNKTIRKDGIVIPSAPSLGNFDAVYNSDYYFAGYTGEGGPGEECLMRYSPSSGIEQVIKNGICKYIFTNHSYLYFTFSVYDQPEGVYDQGISTSTDYIIEMDANQNMRTLITGDTDLQIKGVTDNWLYYLDAPINTKGESFLYRYSLQNGACELLMSGNDFGRISIVSDYIFYADNTTDLLYRMSIDGTGIVELGTIE